MNSKTLFLSLTVLSQTVQAYQPTSEQEAWDNHFSAFGAQDLDQIMLDYNEDSVLKAYEYTEQKLIVAVGLTEIRSFFEGLFELLTDLSELNAPVVQVTDIPSQVFLTWYCPSSNVQSATDTFIFDDNYKFTFQYIAWSLGSETVPYTNATEVQQTPATSLVPIDPEYSQPGVQEAWDNHFDAFGNFDLEAIMQDYTSESELYAYDHFDGTLHKAKGLSQIQEFFSGLFEQLRGHLDDITAPVVNVTDVPEDLDKSVYLVWTCEAAGIKSATDTFMFNADNKITRQNIAFTSMDVSTTTAGPYSTSKSAPQSTSQKQDDKTTVVVDEAASYTMSFTIAMIAASALF